jgi:hypothetical protein
VSTHKDEIKVFQASQSMSAEVPEVPNASRGTYEEEYKKYEPRVPNKYSGMEVTALGQDGRPLSQYPVTPTGRSKLATSFAEGTHFVHFKTAAEKEAFRKATNSTSLEKSLEQSHAMHNALGIKSPEAVDVSSLLSTTTSIDPASLIDDDAFVPFITQSQENQDDENASGIGRGWVKR